MNKILCGPILRNTTKDKVSVWIAFSKNYGLEMKVYQGDSVKIKANTDSNATLVSVVDGVGVNELNLKTPAKAVTAQFGKNLWIALVTAEPQTEFKADKTYSYNINFRSSNTPTDKGDFRTENLLKDGAVNGIPQKAIGYKKDILPTFILPADKPENLFIAHASCRKLHGQGNDALSYLDSLIKKSLEATGNQNPVENGGGQDADAITKKRPQQLYLTGDQIYADNVSPFILNELGVIDGESLVGQEKVQVKNKENLLDEIVADKVAMPPTQRSHIIKNQAGFSTGSSDSHLITFGEYASCYLMYWNLRSWSTEFIAELKKVKSFDKVKAEEIVDDFFIDPDDTNTLGLINIIQNNLDSPAAPFVFTDDSKAPFQSDNTEQLETWKKTQKKRLVKQLKNLAALIDTIPLVSRVLANTPTYMIFDDHEITDDWNITERWQNQVRSKPMGRDIIRNGLMAYTVFQDWGNTPDEYVAIPQSGETNLTSKTKLLRKISEYGHRIGEATNLDTLRDQIINPIEKHLGLGNPTINEIVNWHYKVDCGPTQAIVLDTRTKREFPSLNTPPGLINEAAMDDQVPDTIPFGNAPFTFVVSAVPYFGIPSFEELIQPAVASIEGIKNDSETDPGILAGQLKYDFEAWGMNKKSFEGLLVKLANLKKVIVLSGDVHYGFSSVLDFWDKEEATPKARIVQLTSSALKNEEFGNFHLYRSALVQKLITGIGNNLEHLVWKDKILTVSGNVTMRNRIKLRKNPAVLPVAGWETTATVSPNPDYRYRLKISHDNRTDRKSESIKFENDINLTDKTDTIEAYKKIVQRSQENFITGVHRRMVWPSNVGLVKFKKEENGQLSVKHEFLFKKGDRNIEAKDVGTHIIHEIKLDASGDELIRPELP